MMKMYYHDYTATHFPDTYVRRTRALPCKERGRDISLCTYYTYTFSFFFFFFFSIFTVGRYLSRWPLYDIVDVFSAEA